MGDANHPRVNGLGRELKLIVAGFMVSAAMLLASAAGAVPVASANYSCQLAPNSTCDSPISEAGYYTTFGIFTWERAGCVRVLGYYGEALSSWACVGKQSQGAISRPGAAPGYYRSSLKNNNMSFAGLFQGYYY
jgi:hypothetical protein